MTLLTVILIFIGTILLGILSVVLSKAKLRKDCKALDSFCDHVAGLLIQNAKQEEINTHLAYILENYQEASDIAGEDVYNSPISQLGATIANGNPVDTNLYTRIAAERIKYGGSLKRRIKKLNSHFYNPFVLLYRGVELVMNFVFGYIISKFNPDFDHERNTIWKIINVIVTFLGSIASIVSLFVNH